MASFVADSIGGLKNRDSWKDRDVTVVKDRAVLGRDLVRSSWRLAVDGVLVVLCQPHKDLCVTCIPRAVLSDLSL